MLNFTATKGQRVSLLVLHFLRIAEALVFLASLSLISVELSSKYLFSDIAEKIERL